MSPSPRRIRLAPQPILRPQALPPANRGKALEEAIKAACAQYEKMGRAIVRKIPVEKIHSPKRGLIYLHHGIPDFVGCLGPHYRSAATVARGVAFDAKESREGRVSLDRWKLSEGQSVFLRAYADAGAFSGLVVRLRAGDPRQSEWWLPWGHIEDALARGWASIPEDHLSGRGWRLPRVGGAVMWMDRLEVAP